jgi:hypothetical protein
MSVLRLLLERCFIRPKQFRGLVTRYAERAAYYRAEVVMASFVLWLRRDLRQAAAVNLGADKLRLCHHGHHHDNRQQLSNSERLN